jgi:hypothetical protein
MNKLLLIVFLFGMFSFANAEGELFCTEEQAITFDARIVDAVYDSEGNLIGEDVAVCDYKAAPVECESGSPKISSRMQNKEDGSGFTCHVTYVCCEYS